MGLGRLVPVSLGLALLFTVLGGAMVYLDSVFEEVTDFLWYVIFALLALVLMIIAIYMNITKRIRRIQKRIEESGVDTMQGSSRTMTLDKLEEAIGEWTAKQARVVQELESREEFRREYMGNVSHELKTPIFNIQGYILTLLDGAKDDPKIAARFLKRAAKSVDRMTSLIKDMDVLSKVETGQYDIRLEPVQLNLLIEDTLQGVESYARKNDAKISVDFQVDERIDVLCDSARIEQVLDNLIVNAIKYSGVMSWQAMRRCFRAITSCCLLEARWVMDIGICTILSGIQARPLILPRNSRRVCKRCCRPISGMRARIKF